MTGIIDHQFGTTRGAIRLALSYLEVASRTGSVRLPEAKDVRRIVFVCHGNICRSAFAEAVARQSGLNTASFGLSTVSGNPANRIVADLALQRGIDLTAHRTTDQGEYSPQPGDFLLAMETRQLRRLAANDRLAALPRALLGSYASPSFPHLHDPYELNLAYNSVCLDRIENAVRKLAATFPGAHIS